MLLIPTRCSWRIDCPPMDVLEKSAQGSKHVPHACKSVKVLRCRGRERTMRVTWREKCLDCVCWVREREGGDWEVSRHPCLSCQDLMDTELELTWYDHNLAEARVRFNVTIITSRQLFTTVLIFNEILQKLDSWLKNFPSNTDNDNPDV